MAIDDKKHGNTGKRNALKADLDAGTFGFRLSKAQLSHLKKMEVCAKMTKADYLRALIDADIATKK